MNAPWDECPVGQMLHGMNLNSLGSMIGGVIAPGIKPPGMRAPGTKPPTNHF